MAKITVKTDHCWLHVEGMDMECPLCKVLVKSGEYHECDGKPKPKPRKRGHANG